MMTLLLLQEWLFSRPISFLVRNTDDTMSFSLTLVYLFRLSHIFTIPYKYVPYSKLSSLLDDTCILFESNNSLIMFLDVFFLAVGCSITSQ